MKRKLNETLALAYHIVQFHTNHKRTARWAFVSEPKNIEEHRLGALFVVGDVEPETNEDVPPVLPLVGSALKQEYYAKPRRRALASFSESLRKSNTVFAQVPKKRNPLWLGHVNLAAGSFSEGVLYFTLIGKIRAYLFRGGATVDLARRFTGLGLPHPTKLFRHIASGELTLGDRFFFATPKTFTSLFLEDVRHIVRESPFADIPRQIEMLTQTLERRDPLLLVVGEVVAVSGERPSLQGAVPEERPSRPTASQSPFGLSAKSTPLITARAWQMTRRGVERLARRVRPFGERLAVLAPSRRITVWLQNPQHLRLVALVVGAIVLFLLLVFRREVVL